MVDAVREVAGKRTVERRYFLLSLPLDVATFARAARGDWGIENKRFMADFRGGEVNGSGG